MLSPSGALAEVGFDDAWVGADFLRLPFGDLFAVIQDNDPLGDAHDDLHVVLDQQHSDALGADPLHQFHEFALFLRVGARRRLVQQEQFRIVGQSSRNLQPPLRAVGKIAGVVVGLLPDADEIEQLVRPFGDPRLLSLRLRRLEERIPELGMHAWVLPDPHVVQGGHVREQSDLLKGASDAQVGNLVRLEPGDVAALKTDYAGRRLVEAGNGVEERRLPGAVRTDQRKDLTRSNGEADVIDRGQTAESLDHVVNVENGRRSRPALAQSVASRTSNTASSAVPFSSSCSRMRLGKSPCGRSSMTTTRMSPKTM